MERKPENTVYKFCQECGFIIDIETCAIIILTNYIKELQIMLTGELKNKIDSIWEMFWTGDVVE